MVGAVPISTLQVGSINSSFDVPGVFVQALFSVVSMHSSASEHLVHIVHALLPTAI